MQKSKFLQFIFFFILISSLYPDYPEICALNRRDIIFKQLQDDIKVYYAAKSKGRGVDLPVITFYKYQLRESDDIFALSARLNLPYDTIASLNHISNPDELHERKFVLIANIPGIFMPKKPGNDLEDIMISWRVQKYDDAVGLSIWRNNVKEEFLFFEGDRFHSVERAYFLKILFRFPLEKAHLTSQFGIRADPFTGHATFHNGIDLGAPVGTPVYAAKDGKVIEKGYNDVYGYYVILQHPGNYQTVYGHLSKIIVNLNDEVESGTIIAKSGMSGRCTGPHLHFEIRKKGCPEDPIPLLPIKK
jgi:murein DD-endopeptidase MepM/ murein hydrolase activator NlpD